MTVEQIERIDKFKRKAKEEIDKIPEGPSRRVLAGGRSKPYYLMGKKLMADIKAVIEE